MSEIPALIDMPIIFYAPLLAAIIALNWFTWKVPEVLIPMTFRLCVHGGFWAVMEMITSFSNNEWMQLLNFINKSIALYIWAIVLSLCIQWGVKKAYQKLFQIGKTDD